MKIAPNHKWIGAISITIFSTDQSILKLNSDPAFFNDFYAAALLVYPDLKKDYKEAWLFSGYSFFQVLK